MKALLDREDLVFYPPPLGCVLYLPGLPGGGSKIYDRSPYGNCETIVGATWVRLPSGLWVLSFDGSDDRVDCGNPTALQLTVGTYEAWTRTTRTATTSHAGIVQKPHAFGIGMRVAGGIGYINSYDWGVGGGWRPGVTTPINDGAWHQVVLTFDSGVAASHYVDAVLDANSPFAYTLSNNDFNLMVGCGTSGGGEPWLGDIVMVRVHNRVLSALEIRNHFDREKHLFGVWSR